MRTATRNQFIPTRRERKKAPAYIKRLANVSNTAFELENGDRVIRRPTYHEILTAQQLCEDINRSQICSMLKRYTDSIRLSRKQADRYNCRAEQFTKAWHKQRGRCAFTGLQLAGGPEYLGLGAGFLIGSGNNVQIACYPLAAMCYSCISGNLPHVSVAGWRHISAKEAGSGELEILLWRKIIPALRTATKIKYLPWRYSFEAVETPNKKTYTLNVDGMQINKFNDMRDYGSRDMNLPFWHIQSLRTNQTVMTMVINDGMVTFSNIRQWEQFQPQKPTKSGLLCEKTLCLADPTTTVGRIIQTTVDTIHEQFVGKYTYELVETTYRHAQNGDLTECDIWRI